MLWETQLLFFSFFFLDFLGINPVSINEAQTVNDSKLNYMELSQAIHPVVGRPFLQLHPCLTQELIRTMPKRWETALHVKKMKKIWRVKKIYCFSVLYWELYECYSKNKLVSWLSCVASAALNLKIHPHYYKLTC